METKVSITDSKFMIRCLYVCIKLEFRDLILALLIYMDCSYRTILLGGGGIGVTPLIGMLKDIYDIDVSEEHQRATELHALDTIYFLW